MLRFGLVVAAVAEVGGAWLIWQGACEPRGVAWIVAGIAALAADGFVATLPEDSNFGRHVIVRDDDAEPQVAQVVSIHAAGNREMQVLQGTLASNTGLLERR